MIEKEKPCAGVFGRMQAIVRQRTAELSGEEPQCIFLGQEEWADLVALCKKWEVEWPAGSVDYDPVRNELSRGQFFGVKVYRVDSKTFLAVI